MRATSAAAAAFLAAACGATSKSVEADGSPALLYSADFADEGALRDLVFSDPAAWGWSAEGPALELTGGSGYRPPHRSPLNVALVEDLVVGDFVLEADLMQTGREYGHRDLCLFFGFEAPDRYYYVHLATTPDEHAHNVFLVDRADRRALAPVAAAGVDWGTGVWHRVRLERSVAEGTVRVFFDDAGEPVIEAVDRTIGAGRIGFGSFDDQGRFARVRVRGERAAGVVPAPGWPGHRGVLPSRP